MVAAPPRTSGMLPPPRLLAAARVLVGLSQRELAAEAGLAASVVGRYEAGLSTLRSDSFGAILTVLRGRGIRFADETEEVAMGVFVLRADEEKVSV
jgi:transcriptional regulator with XRE-family HTH domain